MKRVLALFVLMSAAVQAQELTDTWKQLSDYRVVSGAKATVVGIGSVQALYTSYRFAKATANVFGDTRTLFAWNSDAWDKWNDLIGNSAATIGLLYMASKLGWEYFPGFAKHALAIK